MCACVCGLARACIYMCVCVCMCALDMYIYNIINTCKLCVRACDRFIVHLKAFIHTKKRRKFNYVDLSDLLSQVKSSNSLFEMYPVIQI